MQLAGRGVLPEPLSQRRRQWCLSVGLEIWHLKARIIGLEKWLGRQKALPIKPDPCDLLVVLQLVQKVSKVTPPLL